MALNLSSRRPAKPLPDAQVREHARRWRATGDQAALEQVVISNLGLAHRIARGYINRSVEFDDLFQEAVLGLIRGCEKYDPERPERISTYARWWIEAFVRRYVIANNGPVRFGSYALDRKIVILITQASKASAGNIDAEDIAFALDTSVENVRYAQMRMGHRDVSLSKPMRQDEPGGETFGDRLADETDPGPERLAVDADLRARVDAVLEKMPAREAMIVRRRVLSDEAETLDAIGDDLGITRERVRQLETRALERIRLELTGSSKPRRRAA